jgi:multidrug efflux pump subunit AcrA (membrane-fusion protein)
MMSAQKRHLLMIAGAITLLALGWWLFRPSPILVETTAVERGELTVTVDAEGRTRFKDKITVTAPVSGKLNRVRLKEGDLLPKDYVITFIDPTPPTPRPPSQTEELLNPYGVKIYAPIRGRILRVLEPNDRFVQAGTPILEMGNPEGIEVVSDILSSDAVSVRPGATALIDMENYAEPLNAWVRTVEPQAFTKVSSLGVEERRVNIILEFARKDFVFGDNYRVDVKIVVWHGRDVLKVPSSALFREGANWNVFVVERGRAVKREVVAGHRSASETEIIDGVSEGETVILLPTNQLENGSRVAGT